MKVVEVIEGDAIGWATMTRQNQLVLILEQAATLAGFAGSFGYIKLEDNTYRIREIFYDGKRRKESTVIIKDIKL